MRWMVIILVLSGEMNQLSSKSVAVAYQFGLSGLAIPLTLAKSRQKTGALPPNQLLWRKSHLKWQRCWIISSWNRRRCRSNQATRSGELDLPNLSLSAPTGFFWLGCILDRKVPGSPSLLLWVERAISFPFFPSILYLKQALSYLLWVKYLCSLHFSCQSALAFSLASRTRSLFLRFPVMFSLGHPIPPVFSFTRTLIHCITPIGKFVMTI